MERKYTIYMHTTPSGKVYIGQTCYTDPNRRWRNGRGYKTCTLFYNSIKKYGWDNIVHNILHTGLTKEKADILEKMYIQFFKRKNISLNITDGGEGHTGPLSAEHRRKISEAHKGKVLTAETRRKISESEKGKHLSEETRRKIIEGNKGKHRSSETRRKIGEANKRRIWTEDSRRKISEANKGKRRGPLSEETRRKMSEGAKQRKRCIWLNEFNEEVEMGAWHVKRYHKNWVKVRDL